MKDLVNMEDIYRQLKSLFFVTEFHGPTEYMISDILITLEDNNYGI